MKKIYIFLLLLIGVSSITTAQTNYFSKAGSTDFNDVNTWGTAADGTGTSPTAILSTDTFNIANAAILSLSADASVARLRINAGSLSVAANSLTISHAVGNNSALNIASNASLNVSGGRIILNGQFAMVAGAKFAQSGGTISVDGNAGGVALNSIAGIIVNLTSVVATDLQLTGGTLIIVDPSYTTQFALNANCAVATNATIGHTIQYGDGVSTDPGGTSGFSSYLFPGVSYLIQGNVVANGGIGTNRFVTTTSNHGILGNLTVNTGSEYRVASSTYLTGNLVNNGTLSTTSLLYFGSYANAVVAPATVAQTVSGTGVFRNLTAAPTANFASVTVNNTSSAGVSFANGFSNIATQPANSVSISGTLIPTAGKISSGNNLFVLGTSVPAAGTLTYTTGTQLGGFVSGTTFGRWYTAAGTGTAIAAGADPLNGTSRFPFITSANATRSMWISRVTPTAAGVIGVTYNELTGTSAVSPIVADAAYTINTRSNDSWTTSLLSGTAAAATYTLSIVAPGAYAAPDATTRIMKVASVVGTHQNGTATPGGQRIAVSAADLLGTFYLGYNLPTCFIPTALSNVLMSTTAVNHSWTAPVNGLPSGYEWAVTTSSIPPASGTATTVTTASTTGLTPSTTYYLHVRTFCGGTDFSTWSTTTFYTGYCLASATAVTSWISAFSTTGGVTNIVHTAAAGVAGGYVNLTATFVSNYLGQATNFSITSGGPTVGNAIWVDWNNNFVFETTERMYVSTAYGTTVSGSFAIPAATSNGNYRMRVITDFNNPAPSNPCGLLTRGEYKDFTFSVVDAPTCIAPTALLNSNVTAVSASHAWTAATPVPAVGYQWAVTTTPAPPTASGIATTGLSASSTGLTLNTTYYLHVRSDCGAGLFSPWATSSSFFTGYCTPAPSSIDGSGITNVTFGTINNTTGAEAGNYANYSAQSSTHQQGTTVPIAITYATGYTYGTKIWIDFNDDLDFLDAGELVYTGLSLATNPTTLSGNISITGTATVGAHRLRIGGTDTDAGPSDPCYTGPYGTFEDYTINITAGTPCTGAPTAVTVTPANFVACTTTSATFTATTTSTGIGITYQWESSPAGLNTWTPISGATANTYAVTGVSVSTDYHCILTCSGNSTTSSRASITINGIPANDEACGAIGLTLDGAVDCGNTTCATAVGDPTLPGGCSTPNNTVWYSFTPTFTQSINVRLTTPATGNLSGWLNWFTATGTCPTLTFTAVNAACQPFGQTANDVDTLASPVLTAGTTYYIMIDGNSGAFGAYCINLLSPPVPPNCTTNISPANGATGILPPATLSWNAAPTASSYTIFFSSVNNPPLPTDSATTLTGTVVTLTGALPSTTYYWYVTPKNAGGAAIGCSSSASSFTTALAPPNDLCDNALDLSVSNGYCATPLLGTLSLADSTTGLGNASCATTALRNDVWYKITVPASGNVTVQTSAVNTTVNDVVLEAYSGTCGLLTSIGCDDDGNPDAAPSSAHSKLGLVGRTPGEIILIRVMPYAVASQGAFAICAFDTSSTVIPAVALGTANACTNAVALNIDSAFKYTWATFKDAAGNIIAQVYPNGNKLGNTTSSFYRNTNAVRQAGTFYLDRNITITPTTQPTSGTVTVRLFYTAAELAALQAADPAVTNANLNINKAPTACSPTFVGAGAVFISQSANGAYGADRYIDIANPSFSEFFIKGSVGVLPISIEFFKGSKFTAGNFLDWKVTCTSASTVELTLERSDDGRNFKTINTQNETAARCLQSFSYTDATPLAGANYYRLKIATPDGQFRYSSIVVLLNKEKGFELISVAPNPVKDRAILTLTSAKAGKMEIIISDIAGKIVSKQSLMVIAGNNPIPLNVAILGTGTYTIAAINAEGETKTTRFVKF